ncbi:lipoprotein [Streptomyces mashuensis]|uniref:Lipoprotein n=1 Tax=Streptomyces mashuensis TaxID=33904 RepID=A0A919BAI7_9ACTN|nr:hypothetical protein [Streptomyces mashuensis]GHF73686.1 lipoprotein [Streptomyces mashuensis]
MPLTTTTRAAGPAPGPRRRSVLAGGAAGLLAAGAPVLTGCSSGGRGDTRAAGDERRARERQALASAELLRWYDATLAAHPDLAPRLAPLREEVARHTAAFRPQAASPASPSPEAPSPTPSGGPSVPGDPKAALAALADAERRTAEARTAALASATPQLARLLASVAAAGAAHAYLLTGGEA